MRLLSNFDTALEKELLDEYKKWFGDDLVISIHKSRRFYIMYVLVPFARFFCVFAIGLYLVYMLEFDYQPVAQLAFWILILVYLLITAYKASRQYMNWKMDFLVVTPKEVIKYNQSWILHRDTETIHVDKIKSVTVWKHGLVNSFLDIGKITFLAEWEDAKGDIIMSHIDAVDQVEKKIRTIMGMNA